MKVVLDMRITKLTPGSNLRWESSRMMLPEHIERIRQRKEEQKKVEKPELDEQELIELGYVVMDSLNHELDVRVVYWEEGFYKEVFAVVDRVDMQTKRMKLRMDEGFICIDIACLKSVERV